jgi:endonuclease YncB( thermonuclease family)
MRPWLLASCLAVAAGSLVIAHGGVNIVPSRNDIAIASPGTFSCPVLRLVDGDTLICEDGTRVRLSGIDAREKDGSCAPGHPCASAPPEAATAELDRLTRGETLSCDETGTTYNRKAAFCRTSAGLDLSCAMLASGTVAKWNRYWGNHGC